MKLSEYVATVLTEAVKSQARFDVVRKALHLVHITELGQLPQYLSDENALVRFAAELVLEDLRASRIRKKFRRVKEILLLTFWHSFCV